MKIPTKIGFLSRFKLTFVFRSNSKIFLKIFALLLNTKVNTAEKIKKIIKIALETTIKIWSGQKQQLDDFKDEKDWINSR